MRYSMRAGLPITIALFATIAACADVTLSSDTPASIQFDPLPAPAIVVGDSLRDINGVVAPATVSVFNQAGEPLKDTPVFFTYADARRDTAIFVDSTRGIIVSLRPLATTGTLARISARAGSTLQAIRTVLVTTRPDSLVRDPAARTDTLFTTLPDTGTGVAANTSPGIQVIVRHSENGVSTQVPNWLVKFQLDYPVNADNDSTKSVFLVNDGGKPSLIDTTDGSGLASRAVRVRSSRFPAGATPDSVVVRAIVSYKGVPLKGSPIRVLLPVKKKLDTTGTARVQRP